MSRATTDWDHIQQRRRRLVFLAAALTGVTIATNSGAGPMRLGGQVALPVPAYQIGNDQLGISSGFTIEERRREYFGIGMDVVYHYWPANSEYQAAFEREVLLPRLQRIDSPTWAFSAIQTTAHFKFFAPRVAPHRPWIQLGTGVYWLDRNLKEPDWSDATGRSLGGPLPKVVAGGWNASVGVDIRIAPRHVIGVNANYHRLFETEDKDLPEFAVLTLGTHLLFDW